MSLEQHTDSAKPKLDAARAQIRSELRHTPREDAISSTELANRTGIKATTVRDIVSELKDELPIRATSKGYYVITTPDDLERELKSIDEEIATKRETKQRITKAFNQLYYG